ncbi:MAG: ferredoxin [Oscillatoriales cyanobacterium SM2_2_1]|nr:ferredoxin [Oscillatoriales cyanobacterium SM2_2_1]
MSMAEQLAARVQSLHLPQIERHLFLCADQSKPLCCDRQHSLAVWDYLKRRITELQLGDRVFRTKANCLRVCLAGPILVIYPDRVWYHSVTESVIERILREHVIGGQIVSEYVLTAPKLP